MEKRIAFILIFIGTSLAFAGYLAPWSSDYPEKFSDVRKKIIATAQLAPTPHNMQPHRFVLSVQKKDELYLYIETKRLLGATDPNSRQILIGHGIVLKYVEIAAKKYGYKTDITLFPEGDFVERSETEFRDKPTAVIKLLDDRKSIDRLFEMIYKRRTNRMHYINEVLPETLVRSVESSSSFPQIRCRVYHKDDKLKAIRKLTIEGVKTEAATKAPMEESMEVFRFSRKEKDEYGYGLTLASRQKSGFMLGVTEFFGGMFSPDWKGSGEMWVKQEVPALETTPGFLVIVSEKNDSATQIQTGMVYGAAELTALDLGYNMQPVMQTTQEYAEIKNLNHEAQSLLADDGSTVQMIVRLGKAVDTVSEASPRMEIEELIPIN